MNKRKKIDRRKFITGMAKYSAVAACGAILVSTNSCESESSGSDDDKYTINSDKCTGCTACLAACKFDAIAISNSKAVISSSKCVGCGRCVDYCSENAILIS